MTPTRRPRSPVRQSTPPSIVALAGFCLALLLQPTAVRAEVKVEKKPPAVEYKAFDPASPPEGMPPLKGGEAAVTVATFPCDVRLGVEMTQRVMPNDKTFVTYRVARVTVSLSLTVVVWLPEGADARVKAHQEGHRRIAEQAYERAEAAARQAAAKIDGHRVGGDAPNLPEAEKKANERVVALNERLTKEYAEAVSTPTARVREIYDELTGHGAKVAPDVAAAVKLSFQRQAAEAKRAPGHPGTRAATRATSVPSRTSVPATRPAPRPGPAR